MQNRQQKKAGCISRKLWTICSIGVSQANSLESACPLKSGLGGIVNKYRLGAFAGCIAFMIASVPAASAQSPDLLDFGIGRPVPPGDASMGRNMFNAVCWACHSSDLSGYKGPPLTGSSFYKIWQGRRVDALFDLIRNTMPKDDPGMSERAARDLVSYIVAYANRPESLKSGK